ncbi:MAG TPA: glycoside hydrolase family 18 protein [Chitinophagaceae bacterium]
MRVSPSLILISFLLSYNYCYSQSQAPSSFTVTAYYSGNASAVDSFEAEKLTHIIFSFCHLKSNRLAVDDAGDSVTITKLVGLKKRNPALKVLLSLGGWGGCESCSQVFSSARNRKEFAVSVKDLNEYFGTDGIDLDWEYPTIPGYPGHKYAASDKPNFTALVKQLRRTLGPKAEISFAAGGFPRFLQEAVEWKKVMKHLNRVNLMTYDLVHGFDTVTGHHTPLYSTPTQQYSVDNAVDYLVSIGIDPGKLVVGAAFYARVWENVPPLNNGLYQSGKFRTSIGYRDFPIAFSASDGFEYYRDSIAHAPYIYNPVKKLFVTYDDQISVGDKTRYALQNKLNGIMFWQLTHDARRNGLLHSIHQAIRNYP